MVVFRLNSYDHVGLERPRDFLSHELVYRPPVNSAHQLAHQMREGQSVVARLGARLPERFLRCQHFAEFCPVVHDVFGHWLGPASQSRPMAHHLAHGDFSLACLGELRPIIGHGLVELQLAPVDQHVRAQRDEPFGGRPDIHDGICLPRTTAGFFSPAAPEIHQILPVANDRHRSPHFVAFFKVLGKSLSDSFKPRANIAGCE